MAKDVRCAAAGWTAIRFVRNVDWTTANRRRIIRSIEVDARIFRLPMSTQNVTPGRTGSITHPGLSKTGPSIGRLRQEDRNLSARGVSIRDIRDRLIRRESEGKAV